MRPQRDEERSEVLDQQRDPDCQPVDRQEVEPLDEREPRDAEREQVEQLTPRDVQLPRREDRHDREQPYGGSERAHLGEPVRRQPRRQDRLRDGAVHTPEERRGSRHQIAEPRVPDARRLDGKRGLAHSVCRLSRDGRIRTDGFRLPKAAL
jgi:hypothetical protein